MAEPIELEKSRVDKEPYLVWNAFIHLIAQDPYELSDVQGVAHLAFWYDAEVQNGGHLQYFENMFSRYGHKEDILVLATLEALKIIGAEEQAEILSQASEQHSAKKRKHPLTVEEFVNLALEDEFGEFDKRYYHCSPDINSYLEEYLQTHMSEFVKLV